MRNKTLIIYGAQVIECKCFGTHSHIHPAFARKRGIPPFLPFAMEQRKLITLFFCIIQHPLPRKVIYTKDKTKVFKFNAGFSKLLSAVLAKTE